VTLAQVIDKPVEGVFNVVVDVTSFRGWNPPAKSARKLNEGTIGEETGFEFEVARRQDSSSRCAVSARSPRASSLMSGVV
jgi:uncharacterized protein YndB with AHSA1/START domain